MAGMADTSQRMLRLLSLLQNGRAWSGAELTEALGTSSRSMRRDIDRLRELGYPVESLRGPGGHYRLVAGKALPPLMFEDDEVVTVALGLRMVAGGLSGVQGAEEGAERALGKIERVLPSRLSRRASTLASAVDPGRRVWPGAPSEVLTGLGEAVAAGQSAGIESAISQVRAQASTAIPSLAGAAVRWIGGLFAQFDQIITLLVLPVLTFYLLTDQRRVRTSLLSFMPEVMREALAANGLSPQELKVVVPHQANLRISQMVQRALGLSDEQVHEIVDQAREHGEIAVANRNAPGQIVLSGVIPALVFALEMSKTVGARRAVQLTVSVASPSPLMRRARDEFGQILARVPFREPKVPMLGNVHASVIHTAEGLRDELTEHLVHGVQWTGTVRRMVADGVTDFVEIGPGRVLTGLIKRISPDARTFAVDLPGGAAFWASTAAEPQA